MSNMPQKGFTLVETMIAMAIFSVLALSGVVILRLAVNSQEQLTRSTDMTAQFQIARSLMKNDLAQIVPRLARDEDGDRLAGPFAGGDFTLGGLPREEDGERLLLALMRAGNINPGNRYPRSGLQYVEYFLRDDAIIRRVRNYPDGVEETPASERVLYQDVQDVEIAFLTGDIWDNRFLSGAGSLAPAAVRLTFTHDRLGSIEQLFHVGALKVQGEGT